MIDIEEINDNILVQNLLDIYGDLLTDKQKDIMDLYYFSDLSLREVAQNKNISYQAVRDTLIKSVKILKDYESKLNINMNKEKIEGAVELLKTKDSSKIDEAINILESL